MIKKYACLTAVDDKSLAGASQSKVTVIDGLDIAGTRIEHQSTAGFCAGIII